MFGKVTRDELSIVYAFCRIADDIADAPGLKLQDRRLELELLEHTLKTERYSEGDLLWPALLEVINKHSVPKKYLFELLGGVKGDLGQVRVPDQRALEQYSYLVAGTVGAICAIILGGKDKATIEGAKKLGIAMQITNILRDISADAAIGRIYLPADRMRHYGVKKSDVTQGVDSQASKGLLAELAARSQMLYEESEVAIGDLPAKAQRPVRIASALYRGILQRIEQKHYSVYNKRIRLSGLEKIIIALKTR